MRDYAKVYFWPYDVFGYLLPGLVLLAVVAKTNAWAYHLYAGFWHAGELQNLLVIAGLSYVVGHAIAAAGSWTLERLLLRRTLRWPTQRLLDQANEDGRLARLLLGLVPGYERPYSAAFRKQVRRRFRSTFGFDTDDFHDLFWVVWSHVSLNHTPGFRRATHFLELYGFNRNLSTTALLCLPLPLLPGWTNLLPVWAWTSCCLVLAVLFFSNYAKLLRRLNDEVFRAFVSLAAAPPTSSIDPALDTRP